MSESKGSFESKLSKGWQRFLAHVIEHGLAVGRREPEDFIRHFPPGAIMEGLSERPQLRANILIIATGVRPKIAAKKTVSSCTEDLEIALSENETDAETVVTLFDPDDRVRYLDAELLWKFVTEGSFWDVDRADKSSFEVAQEHLAFMLERGLLDGLVTHRDIVDGVSVTELARLLPRDDLAKIVAGALSAGQSGHAFSEEALLSEVPCATLVKHIPLPSLWERVIVPRISQKYGFENAADEPPPPSVTSPAPSAPSTSAASAPARNATVPSPAEDQDDDDLGDVDDLLGGDDDEVEAAPEREGSGDPPPAQQERRANLTTHSPAPRTPGEPYAAGGAKGA